MSCEIGKQTNTLQFRFQDINKQNLTNIYFEFENFKNPWSALTVQSIRINVFASVDCTGNP